ncbi:MAG: beta-ketoacyl-[acyl-carrier-protein] synthase family protein [Thermoanaerobaculia bacterium]
MSARPVAVTGIGVVASVGADRESFWESLCAGRPGFSLLDLPPGAELKFRQGGVARAYDPPRHFEPKQLDLADRFSQFLLVAAREALADSGLAAAAVAGERTAIVTGSCLGGQTTEDAYFVDLYQNGKTRMPPLSIPRIMANAGASLLTMELGVTGPSWTVSTACSSSNHALGQALWLLRHGQADLAIAGGSEAPFSYGNLKAWEALRSVSPDTCRPFSADRSGLVLGEGAAVLILEPLDRARARGARPYAELAGLGMSSDARHITQPSAEGAARAIVAALADAGLAPEQIDYVNAHGTATLANDPVETRALRIAHGAHAERLAISSTKSMHGHALGAAGALEAAATCLALARGILPPTANFTRADPECDLDVIPNTARRREIGAALSNSFAFGGLNAVLAFRACPGRKIG